MYSVLLNAWSPGFVAVRLIELLKDFHFGLAAAHRLATAFVDGERPSIIFDDLKAAERFATAVRSLHVDAFVSPVYAAAG